MIRALLVGTALLAALAWAVSPGRGLTIEVDGTRTETNRSVLTPLAGLDLSPGQELLLRGQLVQDRPGTLFLQATSRGLADISCTVAGNAPRAGGGTGPALGAVDLDRGLAAFELKARVTEPKPDLALALGEEVPRFGTITPGRILEPDANALGLDLARASLLLAGAALLLAILLGAAHGRPRLQRRLLAIALGLVTALVLGEALTRLLGLHPRPRIPGSILVDYDFGPDKTVTYRGVHPTNVQEFTTTVHWNSDGWRDDEFGSLEREHQVALLGDSFVAAHEVELPETFHRLLEDAFPTVEFLALARGGTGPVQQLEFLETEATRRDLDAVLWCLFLGNDVMDSSTLLAQERRTWVETVFYDAIVPTRLKVLDRGHSTGSRLASVLADRSLPWIETHLHRFRPDLSPEDLINPAVQIFRASSMNGDDRRWSSAWSRLEITLSKAARFCRNQDLPLILISIPSENWPLPGLDPSGSSTQDLDRTAPDARLRTFCERKNLPLIELAPAFADPADPPHYFPHDGHFTPAGHALAAKVLQEELERREWLATLR